MKKITALTTMTMLFLSVEAHADWTTASKVSYVHPRMDGFSFALEGVQHNCGDQTQQIFVPWTNEIADKLYSLVLLAFSNGKLVAANYVCQADGTAHTNDIDIR